MICAIAGLVFLGLSLIVLATASDCPTDIYDPRQSRERNQK
jgi:hypothetical protein